MYSLAISKNNEAIIEIMDRTIDSERRLYMLPKLINVAIAGNIQFIVFVASLMIWFSGVGDDWVEFVFVSSEVSCSDTGFSCLL